MTHDTEDMGHLYSFNSALIIASVRCARSSSQSRSSHMTHGSSCSIKATARRRATCSGDLSTPIRWRVL